MNPMSHRVPISKPRISQDIESHPVTLQMNCLWHQSIQI